MPKLYKGSVIPGQPYPLGATYDGSGTNFALFSSAATGVTLCLVDKNGQEEQVPVVTNDGDIWHCYIPGVHPGQRYGYRVEGEWNPNEGQFCNPAKFLVDPYARAFADDYAFDDSLLPYQVDNPDLPSTTDSLPSSMTSVVVSSFFNWEDDHPLRHPLTDTVIYEAHIHGMTKTHPAIPEELRGTYSGMCHPAILEYLTDLGITAVELLPVQQFFHDRRLRRIGLRNYWGYNTFGYFAPHLDYSSQKEPGAQVAEFKNMVKTFHKAGIEIILDVVYNHTAEGSPMGPMLNFRGIDNLSYYRTDNENPHTYANVTGCGNTINMRRPHTVQLILDSLRYWVEEMHVDGFRFDLATTLLRDGENIDSVNLWGNFLTAIHQDPVLRSVKLIAEPWDLGYNGYQVGAYPYPWMEWNGKYRDTAREFWAGNAAVLGDFAGRLTGSADLFSHNKRRPGHSVNFITAHDGFTLRDLVTYEEKRNSANGEDNRDGESHNHNWNCGVEGETDDSAILRLRRQQQRNLLTTLLLSQGTPMLLHGDELNRTQHGNNNVYCQDNELSWINWDAAQKDADAADFHAYTRHILKLRRKHPIFRQNNFFTGKNVPAENPSTELLQHHAGTEPILDTLPDVLWMNTDGKIMEPVDWENAPDCTLMIFLNGHANRTPNPLGGLHGDSSFIFLINGSREEQTFKIPAELLKSGTCQWDWRLDTTLSFAEASQQLPERQVSGELVIAGNSLVLLEQKPHAK